MYCLRLCHTRVMRRLVKTPREIISNYKDSLFSSLELTQYKIATMRCVVQRLLPNQTAKIARNFMACGLTVDDAALYKMLYYNNDIEDFIAQMRLVEDATFTLDVGTLLDEANHDPAVQKGLKSASMYHAYNRVAFLARGNRLSISDFASDLLILGRQAYLWVRPFYNVLHATNYAKLAINRQALVMIEQAEKDPLKKRTIATAEGYNNVCHSYSDDLLIGNVYDIENSMIEYLDAAA